MVQRKRKHAAADSSTPATARTQMSIASFTKVTKARHEDESAKKRKILHDCINVPAPATCTISPSNKRKRNQTEQSDRISGDECRIQTATPVDATEPPSTPRNKRCKTITTQPPDTPSRGAVALFDKLDLGAHRSESLSQLPDELEETKELYTAFLAALSMHYSHNGTASPVNVNTLLPSITSHWKKRKASLEDVRQILTLHNASCAQKFALEDFGRAGICLTRAASSSAGAMLQRTATYIDETRLAASFADNLEQRWSAWQRSTDEEHRNSSEAFWAQIRPAAIVPNASAQKAAPMFARGQQRLADLKAPRTDTTAPASSNLANSAPAAPLQRATPSALQNRSTALLDRILAKQSHLASLPAGPDRAALERQAALQRVEDVARILTLLSGAQGRDRCSFSLPVLTQQIQQSLRTPLSREEVERCLELLARELAPEFVRVVRSGAVTGIVVTRSAAVGGAVLRGRVQAAGSM